MAMDRVSEVFAFVARRAEFTKTILLTEDEVPEIRPEELAAIAAAVEHVRESYIALLDQCRLDLHLVEPSIPVDA